MDRPDTVTTISRLFTLIGDQRHGSEARRAAFICWMCVPVYLMFSFWALGGWFLSVGDAALDGRVLSWTTLYGFTLTFSWIALGTHGLHIDHLRRPDRVYASVVLALYATSSALTCYLVGTLNIVCGLVMMGAPLVGIMLFPLRRILVVLALATGAILAASIASAAGMLPYAPVLSAGLSSATSPGFYYAMSGVVASALYVTYEVVIMLALARAQPPGSASDGSPAGTDALTSVASRSAILADTARWLAGRRGRRGMLMVELVSLREINLAHGVDAGDRALVMVANALRTCLRTTDRVGRTGSGSFLVLLQDATAETAAEVAARCRSAVSSTPLVVGGHEIALGITIGMAAGDTRDFADVDTVLRHCAGNASQPEPS